jgi:hypothetical protein
METLWESRVNEESQIKAAINLLLELVCVSRVRVFNGVYQLSVAECQLQVSIRLTEENVDNPEARKNEFCKTANFDERLQNRSHDPLVSLVVLAEIKCKACCDFVVEIKNTDKRRNLVYLPVFDRKKLSRSGLPEKRRVIDRERIDLQVDIMPFISVSAVVRLERTIEAMLTGRFCWKVIVFVTVIWVSLNPWVIFEHLSHYSCLLNVKIKRVRTQKPINFFIALAPIAILSCVFAIGHVNRRILVMIHPEIVHQSDIVLIFEAQRLGTPELHKLSQKPV